MMDTPNATVDSWWFQSTMVTVDNFALAACYIREINIKVFGKTYGTTWDFSIYEVTPWKKEHQQHPWVSNEKSSR